MTVPSAANAGLSLASASRSVSRRGPSSVSKVDGLAVRGSPSTGTISSSNLPGVDRGHAPCWCDSSAKRVGLLAADPVLPRHVLGGDAHGQVDVGVALERASGWATILLPPIGTRLIDSVPPATTTSASPASDRLGGEGDRLQARRAEAVDGHGRGRRRDAREERRQARHVHPLLGLGHGAAEDHVVDHLRPRAPGRARRAARMTAAARSSGRVCRSVPLRRLAHRGPHAGTITTRRVVVSPSHGSASPFRQFRSGLPFFSMCWMRSWVFGVPRSERNASRSRSRKSCSLGDARARGPRRTGSWPRGSRPARRAR